MNEAQARARLLELVPIGSTVYSMHRSSTKSDQHYFTLFVVYQGEIVVLDHYVAALLHRRVSRIGGVASGPGKGFGLAADLAWTLYPNDEAKLEHHSLS